MDEQTKKEEKTIVQLDFDQILEHIGPHGRYQLTQLPILFVITTCCAISVVLFAFTGYVPKYRCIIPECENVSTATYYDRPVMPYENRDDLSFAEFVTLGIGGIKNDIDAAGVSCQRLSINQGDQIYGQKKYS